MGWFDNFAANGCRKAMQGAYVKGRTAEQRSGGNEPTHWMGLAHALQSRYITRGLRPPDSAVWAELTPFLLIADESAAVSWLAEYVIYQERPDLADLPRLAAAINHVLEDLEPAKEPFATLLSGALAANVGWTRLLTAANRERLSATGDGPTREASDGGPESKVPTVKDIGRFLHHCFLESVATDDMTNRLRERLHAEGVAQVAIQRFPNRLHAFAGFIIKGVADDVFRLQYAPDIVAGFMEPLVVSLVDSGADENAVRQYMAKTFAWLQEALEREQSNVEPLAVARSATTEWIGWYVTMLRGLFSKMKA
jgi:hypothetical protein